MCCVKLVYSEAILVNIPNSVKLEFLQGDARVHLKFLYNCLGKEAIVFTNLGVVELTVTVVTSEFDQWKGHPSKQSSYLVIKNDCWHILYLN